MKIINKSDKEMEILIPISPNLLDLLYSVGNSDFLTDAILNICKETLINKIYNNVRVYIEINDILESLLIDKQNSPDLDEIDKLKRKLIKKKETLIKKVTSLKSLVALQIDSNLRKKVEKNIEAGLFLINKDIFSFLNDLRNKHFNTLEENLLIFTKFVLEHRISRLNYEYYEKNSIFNNIQYSNWDTLIDEDGDILFLNDIQSESKKELIELMKDCNCKLKNITNLSKNYKKTFKNITRVSYILGKAVSLETGDTKKELTKNYEIKLENTVKNQIENLTILDDIKKNLGFKPEKSIKSNVNQRNNKSSLKKVKNLKEFDEKNNDLISEEKILEALSDEKTYTMSEIVKRMKITSMMDARYLQIKLKQMYGNGLLKLGMNKDKKKIWYIENVK